MGAWGIKSCESDEGLDLLYSLEEDYLAQRKEISLSEIIEFLKEEDYLGETLEDIDFSYDNNAIAIAELYTSWSKESGFIGTDYDDSDEEGPWSKVKVFSTDSSSLRLLLQYLYDIKNEVPDEDGEREIVELWKDSNSYEEWSEHINTLIERMEALL